MAKTNEAFAMHDNLTILAEFYPDSLALIVKSMGLKSVNLDTKSCKTVSF